MTSTRARSRGMPRRAQPATTSTTPTVLIVGGIVLLVLLVGAVALALSGGGSSGIAEPATSIVQVQGNALATYGQAATDAAVGQAIPTISGPGLDGSQMTIGPDDGALAIVVVAHWCPHCQVEIPKLTDWMAANQLPDGVRVVTVSTGIDPARPNYPPSAWLEREGWTQPTLTDDASNSALGALGMNSFPAFVFVNEDGTVAQRMTGEISTDAWEAALATIAP